MEQKGIGAHVGREVPGAVLLELDDRESRAPFWSQVPDDRHSLLWIGVADDGDLSNVRVSVQGTLDLGRARPDCRAA